MEQPIPNQQDLALMAERCAATKLRQASRVVTQYFDHVYEPLGLRSTQVTVLSAICAHTPVGVRRLSEIVVMDPSSLSRALVPLEKQGLIVKQVGASRRDRILSPTPEGLAKIEASVPLWEEAEASLAASLGAENLPHLHALMEGLLTVRDLEAPSTASPTASGTAPLDALSADSEEPEAIAG